MSGFLEQVNVGHNCSTDYMLTLVDQSLPEELLNVLDVLLINDLGENSQSICLEHVIVSELDILRQTTDHNKYFVFAHIKFLKTCQNKMNLP